MLGHRSIIIHIYIYQCIKSNEERDIKLLDPRNLIGGNLILKKNFYLEGSLNCGRKKFLRCSIFKKIIDRLPTKLEKKIKKFFSGAVVTNMSVVFFELNVLFLLVGFVTILEFVGGCCANIKTNFYIINDEYAVVYESTNEYIIMPCDIVYEINDSCNLILEYGTSKKIDKKDVQVKQFEFDTVKFLNELE